MPKRKKFSQNERDFIARRAHGCCEYCKILHDYSPDTFEIEHIIALFVGGTNVEGITLQGRATVELLQLNRKGVVNLRKALFAYGVHPVE